MELHNDGGGTYRLETTQATYVFKVGDQFEMRRNLGRFHTLKEVGENEGEDLPEGVHLCRYWITLERFIRTYRVPSTLKHSMKRKAEAVAERKAHGGRAARDALYRRDSMEYQQMLRNLTNTQERCTRQEQEIRDLKAAVFNLTSARSAVVEELEEMTERYENARDRAYRLQNELLEKESE